MRGFEGEGTKAPQTYPGRMSATPAMEMLLGGIKDALGVCDPVLKSHSVGITLLWFLLHLH